MRGRILKLKRAHVASTVAGTIEPALQAAETACSARRPTRNLTAYDLYLRAYAMVLSLTRQAPEARNAAAQGPKVRRRTAGGEWIRTSSTRKR
jgi:hypothetical protein